MEKNFRKNQLNFWVIQVNNERTAMSDYWRGIMEISTGTRWNLAKDFSYIGGFKGSHFLEHVKAVKDRKINYRWMIYITTTKEETERLWEEYKKNLINNGVESEAFECAKGCEPQIQHKLVEVPTSAKPIPWRITIFEDGITLLSPEPSINSYGKDTTTVTFNSVETSELLESFKELWDTNGAPSSLLNFYKLFLKFFGNEYPKDIPIYKTERILRILQRTLIVTTIVIILSTIIQILFHI